MIDANKLTKNLKDELIGFDFEQDTAYHMDAALLGEYLKRHYCFPRKVGHKLKTYSGATLTLDGSIEKLHFTDGSTETADLYIDCTGFKSELLSVLMKEPFVSFSKILKNDRAVAARIDYVDIEREMEVSTNAIALSSGWVWNIPLFNRIGTGYVYSSAFLDPSAAEDEFRQFLTRRGSVDRTERDLGNIDFFHISIRQGFHRRSWVKNVIGIGLSNGFIEPLESTGLMLTHESIFLLLDALGQRRLLYNSLDVASYNNAVRDTMNHFSTFIALHYALAERSDTPYWKHITEEVDYTADHDSIPFANVLPIMKDGAYTNLSGIPYILSGMKGTNRSLSSIEHLTRSSIRNNYNDTVNFAAVDIDMDKFRTDCKNFLHELEARQERNCRALAKMSSHYEFLKEHIP